MNEELMMLIYTIIWAYIGVIIAFISLLLDRKHIHRIIFLKGRIYEAKKIKKDMESGKDGRI